MGAQIRWVIHKGHLIPVLRTMNNKSLAREVSYLVFVRLAGGFTLEEFRQQFEDVREKKFAAMYLRKLQTYGLVELRDGKYCSLYETLSVGNVLRKLNTLAKEAEEFSRLARRVIYEQGSG